MTRPAQVMPGIVHVALEESGVQDRYDARPWNQRNDYPGWINRAKRDETKQKRLNQMLDKLRAWDV